jgi:predicted CxxxxCH...CXXCH cytochrome family protein
MTASCSRVLRHQSGAPPQLPRSRVPRWTSTLTSCVRQAWRG